MPRLQPARAGPTLTGMKIQRLVLLGFTLTLAAGVAAAEPATPAPGRVIVAFKPQAQAVRMHPLSAGSTAATVRERAQSRAGALSGHARVPLSGGRMIDAHTQVVFAPGVDSTTLAQRLASHPDVAQVTVDRRKRALYTPADPLFLAAPADRGPEVELGRYLWPPRAREAVAPTADFNPET